MKRRAFTLIEVLVTVAVFGVLMSAMLTSAIMLFGSISTTYQTTALLDSQARILDYLRRDVRSCSAMKVDTAGTRLILQETAVYEAPLAFPVATSVSSSGVTYGSGTILVYYQSQNGSFTRTAGTEAVQNIAPLTNGLSVTFSPVTLTGSVAPPVVATVSFQMDLRRNSSTALTLVTATLQPRLDAAILP